MKTVTLWRCETCGTNYADKESAQNCEKNHKKEIQKVAMTHKPYKADHSGYPVKLSITFEDDKTIMYKR